MEKLPWHGEGARQLAKLHAVGMPRTYAVPRVDPSKPVDVEGGDVMAEAWAHAPWTDEYVDIQGYPGKISAPRHATRMKMLWDDNALYVGAWMDEPQVIGTLTEKNSVVFQDNDFEVFLDPDGTNHQYYEFEINALGTIWELRLDKPYRFGGSEHSARVGMEGQGNLKNLQSGVKVIGALNDGSVTDEGWSITVAFPFQDLVEQGHCKAAPSAGDVWRINSSRVQWKWAWSEGGGEGGKGAWSKKAGPEDNWVWSPQGLVNMHIPEMWGFALFAGASEESAEGAANEIVRDWEARAVLRDALWLIPDFKAAHSRLPNGMDELGVKVPASVSAVGIDAREDVPGGYVAWVQRHYWRLCIREDSLTWRE